MGTVTFYYYSTLLGPTTQAYSRDNGEAGLMTLLVFYEPRLFIEVVIYLSFSKKTSSDDKIVFP